MVSPSASGIGEPFQDNDAGAVAKHGSCSVGIKGAAVAILGKRASLLIEEAALLRNGDVNAAGESDIAFMVEQRAAGLVDGQESGGTGGIEADCGSAKIQKVGGTQRDVVLLVAIFDGELAGHGQQVRVG